LFSYECYSQILLFFPIQISNSGFEFNMAPSTGEAISAMLPEQQREMSEILTAVTSQEVSLMHLP
jgi:hypothetical protein